jgi:hypothetical protein
MTAAIDWHSPLRCPRCHTHDGHPFSVQSKSVSEIVVAVRCRGCAHEWKLQRETPSLAPKFDRRYPADDNLKD